MLFNKLLLGENVNALKLTVTRDLVDSGERKIVEEINLAKYSDYEVFTLSEVVGKLQKNLDDAAFLRVHLIKNLTYKDSVLRQVKNIE